jgi:hypothetical protein
MAYNKPDVDIDDEDDGENGQNKPARFKKRNINLHDPDYVCDTTKDQETQGFIDSAERLTDFPIVIRFISLVVSGHTYTDAAVKAAEAYKKDWTRQTCQSWASRVMSDPDVKKEYKRKLKEVADASQIDSAYVLRKMAEFVETCHDKKAAAVILKEMGRASGTVKQQESVPAAPIVNVIYGECPEDVDPSPAPEAAPEAPQANPEGVEEGD